MRAFLLILLQLSLVINAEDEVVSAICPLILPFKNSVKLEISPYIENGIGQVSVVKDGMIAGDIFYDEITRRLLSGTIVKWIPTSDVPGQWTKLDNGHDIITIAKEKSGSIISRKIEQGILLEERDYKIRLGFDDLIIKYRKNGSVCEYITKSLDGTEYGIIDQVTGYISIVETETTDHVKVEKYFKTPLRNIEIKHNSRDRNLAISGEIMYNFNRGISAKIRFVGYYDTLEKTFSWGSGQCIIGSPFVNGYVESFSGRNEFDNVILKYQGTDLSKIEKIISNEISNRK